LPFLLAHEGFMRNYLRKNSGFTLIEILLIMLTITTLLQMILPNIRGMQAEGNLTRVEQELGTLKTAIISYWRAHDYTYPTNITTDLVEATPQILASMLFDPFRTVGNTYGYQTGDDPTFGPWFAVYSKGPKGDTTSVDFDIATQHVRYNGTGRVVSNAPVLKY